MCRRGRRDGVLHETVLRQCQPVVGVHAALSIRHRIVSGMQFTAGHCLNSAVDRAHMLCFIVHGPVMRHQLRVHSDGCSPVGLQDAGKRAGLARRHADAQQETSKCPHKKDIHIYDFVLDFECTFIDFGCNFWI